MSREKFWHTKQYINPKRLTFPKLTHLLALIRVRTTKITDVDFVLIRPQTDNRSFMSRRRLDAVSSSKRNISWRRGVENIRIYRGVYAHNGKRIVWRVKGRNTTYSVWWWQWRVMYEYCMDNGDVVVSCVTPMPTSKHWASLYEFSIRQIFVIESVKECFEAFERMIDVHNFTIDKLYIIIWMKMLF